jgi:hypothetical protein
MWLRSTLHQLMHVFRHKSNLPSCVLLVSDTATPECLSRHVYFYERWLPLVLLIEGEISKFLFSFLLLIFSMLQIITLYANTLTWNWRSERFILIENMETEQSAWCYSIQSGVQYHSWFLFSSECTVQWWRVQHKVCLQFWRFTWFTEISKQSLIHIYVCNYL